jgi:hypothetical protein
MKRLQFHTVVQAEDIPVYSVVEVKKALWTIDVDTHTHFKLIVAPYRPEKKDQESLLPKANLYQLRVVHHVIRGWSLDNHVMLVRAENSDSMAAGTAHTRRTCLQGPDCEKWLAAKYDMLDKNNSYRMHGGPTSQCDVPPDAKVVQPIWNCSQKGLGIHKVHKFMNGKQLVRLLFLILSKKKVLKLGTGALTCLPLKIDSMQGINMMIRQYTKCLPLPGVMHTVS